MRDYAWSKDYIAVVCETDDKVLINKVEDLIGGLTERFASLAQQVDTEERARVANAIAALLVLKSERFYPGKISRPSQSAELN